MTDGDAVVLDASAMVDFLVGHAREGIGRRLGEATVHVPAHFDAEVLSAVGRLCRAGRLTAEAATNAVAATARAPFERHTLQDIVSGAWRRRENVSVVDALYVELAERLRAPLLTTDVRLARAYQHAELM